SMASAKSLDPRVRLWLSVRGAKYAPRNLALRQSRDFTHRPFRSERSKGRLWRLGTSHDRHSTPVDASVRECYNFCCPMAIRIGKNLEHPYNSFQKALGSWKRTLFQLISH